MGTAMRVIFFELSTNLKKNLRAATHERAIRSLIFKVDRGYFSCLNIFQPVNRSTARVATTN